MTTTITCFFVFCYKKNHIKSMFMIAYDSIKQNLPSTQIIP